MKEYVKPAVVMFLTCVLAAGSLALVNALTGKPIAENERRERENAMKVVLPRATGFRNVVPDKVWAAFDGDAAVGHVLSAASQGYSGPISVTFGVDPENRITGVKIVSQTETPGLGSKIVKPAFTDQFRGMTLDRLSLKKDDPAAGAVDAITGATISPRAVTRAVHDALAAFLQGETTAAGAAKEIAP